MNVTIYDSVKSHKPKIIPLSLALKQIKVGGKVKDDLEKIAQEKDKKKRSQMKVDLLPVICFNGEFEKREIDGVKKSSGIIVLDIDGLDDYEESKNRREEIASYPYVKAAFISPSQKGIKFLVRIPNITKESPEEIDLEFKGYFQALQKEFPDIDPSGKDISRACFISYDPDVYINEEPTIFTKWEEYKKSGEKVELTELPSIDMSRSQDLQGLMRKVADAPDGQRHNTLYNMSRLAGGFISAGRVSKDDAIKALELGFISRPYDSHYDYQRTIEDGINVGLPYPKYLEEEQLQSAHPDDADEENSEFSMYVEFDEFEEEAEHLYKHGNERGLDGRFNVSREFMSYKIGYTTYIYSAPFSGKTQFAMSELTYLAERYGWNIAVFSLEMGAPKDVLAEVASIYIGKLYTSRSSDLKMNGLQKEKAIEFFKKHFHVLDPVFKKNDIEVTVDNILKEVKLIEQKKGIHIDSVYIDPISELDDGGEERIHKFTYKVNKLVNRDARLNDRHNFLVSHVRDQQGILDKTENKTYYPVPTPRDVSGGQNTFKQGYQMICVYRPPSFLMNDDTKEYYKKNETQIHIQKAKPKGVGTTGEFTLFFDWKTNRYYEDAACTVYSEPLREEEQQEEMDLQPTYTQPISKENFDFNFGGEDEVPF